MSTLSISSTDSRLLLTIFPGIAKSFSLAISLILRIFASYLFLNSCLVTNSSLISSRVRNVLLRELPTLNTFILVLKFSYSHFQCQKHHITDVTCIHLNVCISQLEGTCLYITRIICISLFVFCKWKGLNNCAVLTTSI